MSFLKELFGPPDVEKLKAKKDVSGLMKALRNKKHSFTRELAVTALGELGDPVAVPSLLTALEDEEWTVRWHAAEALGKIGDARAVESLIAALNCKGAEVRQAAAHALERIGWRPDRSQAGAAYWVEMRQWDQCVAIGAPAVEPLITALKDERAGCCQAAAEALGRIADPLAVKSLVGALASHDAQLRRAAAEALGKIGNPQGAESLTDALMNDPSVDVRNAAAEALVKIGAPAVESLISDLSSYRNRTTTFRLAAIETLDKIGWQPDEGKQGAAYWVAKKQWKRCVAIGAPAIEPLVFALLYDWDAKVREAAAKALGRIGTFEGVEELMRALKKDEDPRVRAAAIDALVKIGDPRAQGLVIDAVTHGGKPSGRWD